MFDRWIASNAHILIRTYAIVGVHHLGIALGKIIFPKHSLFLGYTTSALLSVGLQLVCYRILPQSNGWDLPDRFNVSGYDEFNLYARNYEKKEYRQILGSSLTGILATFLYHSKSSPFDKLPAWIFGCKTATSPIAQAMKLISYTYLEPKIHSITVDLFESFLGISEEFSPLVQRIYNNVTGYFYKNH